MDATLKVWANDEFMALFHSLCEKLGFTGFKYANFFIDTMNLLKTHCDGKSIKMRKSKEKTCRRYVTMRTPRFEFFMRKICKVAMVKNVSLFEKQFADLISYHCSQKSNRKLE